MNTGAKKFIRKIEDFDCEHCGKHIHGNGYTNHCPECLFSKHVDINPGDRLAHCGGLMEPISVKFTEGNYSILHHCVKCNFEKMNKVLPEDNFAKVLELAPQH